MRQPLLSPRRTLLALGLATAAMLPAGAGAEEFKVGGRVFRVAEGFKIERIAGPPLVDRPITAAIDERGRMYVSDSSGSNENVKKQLADKPHRIVRLEDKNGDGVYDSQTVFADHMMFPEGTLWFQGSLYVSAPPSIWKLTDTDDDGVAESRVEWYQGKTLTGCANDLHGPYAGLDGWIYWCKGAFAEQTHERPGREPLVTRAAHIFRCRPDGTGIEPVMTGGMDNPVDVVFTPGGERIFTTTFLVRPGGGQRDGLIHAIYGGIYGKLQASIFDPVHAWTGPEVMPVLLHMGPAAPCGLVRYESTALGERYRDNVFACYFNLHKVSRHVLTPAGATFTTKDEDFVSSPDLDFHPTDVIEDADGGLVIVDTGGWYKLCCPTSQLHKPDVLGGVYRVTRVGVPRTPNLASARHGSTAIDRLDDARPATRHAAIEELASPRLAPASIALLAKGQSRSATWRQNAVWTLTRIDQPEARAAARGYLADADETTRQAAIHSASLWRDRGATRALIEIVATGTPQNRRAAAEALGRIGDPAAVSALLAAAGDAHERILEHSLTYALIEIADPRLTAVGLESPDPRVVRTALVALDQMRGGRLEPRLVAGLLASSNPALKANAAWIVGRHREWAGELAGVLGKRLDLATLAAAERADLETQLGRFAQAPPIQALLADRLESTSAPVSVQLSALRAMAAAGLKETETPTRWVTALAAVLKGKGAHAAEILPQAVATCRSLAIPRDKAGPLHAPLSAIAQDVNQSPDLRLSALAAVPGGLVKPDPRVFAFLVGQLAREIPTARRTTAADVLARAKLDPEQLDNLTNSLANAGPLELDRLLFAFDQSTERAIGTKLIQALANASAVGSLRADAIKTHVAHYPPEVQASAAALYARLNVDADHQKAKLDQLVSTLSAGDIRRGQLVFQGDKASCYACHAIGYRGGDVGPDLTKIGSVRSERDLLESILFPSASFVRSFEPIAVATNDGKVYNGLLKGETADEIVLAVGVNQTTRVVRSSIEEITPSKISVMPAGLDQQLSPQELADLVAFLRACR